MHSPLPKSRIWCGATTVCACMAKLGERGPKNDTPLVGNGIYRRLCCFWSCIGRPCVRLRACTRVHSHMPPMGPMRAHANCAQYAALPFRYFSEFPRFVGCLACSSAWRARPLELMDISMYATKHISPPELRQRLG